MGLEAEWKQDRAKTTALLAELIGRSLVDNAGVELGRCAVPLVEGRKAHVLQPPNDKGKEKEAKAIQETVGKGETTLTVDITRVITLREQGGPRCNSGDTTCYDILACL